MALITCRCGRQISDKAKFCPHCGFVPNVNLDDFEIEDSALIEYKGPGGDVTIPNGITSIDVSAFADCTELKSITLPDSIIHIGIRAFYGCNELRSITIPDSVTSIGEDAFSDRKNITIICNPGSHAEKYAKACGITYDNPQKDKYANNNNPIEQRKEPVIISKPETEECPDFYEDEIYSDDYYEYYDYTWFEPPEKINISEWWHLYYDDDADFVNKYDDWTMDPQ